MTQTDWRNSVVAGSFEEYNDILEWILGYSFVHEWIDSGNEETDSVILDYGCGPGKVAYYFACQGNKQIIAVDESENMLEIAKTKRRHPKVDYRQVIDDDLYYIADNSIDACILCFVLLNHGSSKRIIRILQEINRVLKHKASCIILDTHPDSVGFKFSTFQSGVSSKIYRCGESREAWLFLPGGKIFPVQGHHWPKKAYYDMLEESGFKKIEEKAPILKDIPKEKLAEYYRLYENSNFAAEQTSPPFILFRAYK